jgi:hypothetical protein
MQVKPMIMADSPTAARGTEAITKYEIGVKIAPAAQSDIPNSLYGRLLNADPPT